MIFNRSGFFNRTLFLLSFVWLVVACEGAQESDELSEAIEVGRQEVVSLQVQSQDGKTLFETSEEWQFSVIATRFDGSTFDASRQVSWHTEDSTVARINQLGALVAQTIVGSQSTSVIARWAYLESSAEITVSDAELIGLSASAQDNPVDECRSTQLIASGNYSDGSIRLLDEVTWNLNDVSVGRVEGNQLTTLNSGNIDVVANRESISSPALTVVINDSLNAISFSSGSQLNARLGETLQLQTIGSYTAEEADITSATAWESADQTIAEVSNEGILEANQIGSTSVNAECGGLVESLQVTVIDATEIRIVDPEDSDMEGGESRQLELFNVFSDGSLGTNDLADDDKVVWDIDSGEEVASISSEGEVTLVDDLSDFDDSFIRVFAEYEGFEDTLVIRLAD